MEVWTILAQLIAGFFLGDLFSGIFHWWEDRYGSLTWPRFLVDHVVLANIEHHQFPSNTCKRTYWYRCGSSILATAPLIVLCFYLGWYVVGIGLAVLSQANEVHAWAHKKANPVIRFFQSTGLLLSVKHHAIHHRRPYSERYCVVTDWLNPILEGVRFWRTAECGVWILFGAIPNTEREVY